MSNTPPDVVAATTFGFELFIWNTSLGTPAYSAISGIKPCNVPTLEVESMVDTTTHGSASGIKTSVPSGVLKWDDVNGEFNIDASGSGGANADPGQLFLIGQIGAKPAPKFKAVVNGVTVPAAYFYATVKSVKPNPETLNGVRSAKFVLEPSGVAPTS